MIFPIRRGRARLMALVLLALPALACDLSLELAGQPTATPMASPTPPPPQNIITNGVTAQDVKGDNFDPVGITDAFPADQKIFHAVVTISNAPANTAVKVVWLTAANAKMGEYEIKSDGSRNLDFTFKPSAGQLAAGNYKVEIYLNDKLDRTLVFAVSQAASAQPTTGGPRPSGYISAVTMAEDVKGEDKAPVNPTIVFKPTAAFHAVVATQNAPANTTFKASWYVTDVGSAAAPNTLIDATELTTDGSRNIDFSLKPKTQWPAGTYRVEVFVNGVLDTVKSFSVK